MKLPWKHYIKTILILLGFRKLKYLFRKLLYFVEKQIHKFPKLEYYIFTILNRFPRLKEKLLNIRENSYHTKITPYEHRFHDPAQLSLEAQKIYSLFEKRF